MKNGRALTGHRRVLVPIGVVPALRRPPRRGWDVKCICGWVGGNWAIRTPALLAYRAHLDHAIDEGLFKCRRCGVEKRIDKMRRDYRWICLECSSEIGNEWQARNKEASRLHKRKHHLLKYMGNFKDDPERLRAAVIYLERFAEAIA